MKQPTVYAVVRTKDGQLVKRPIKFDSTNHKVGRKMYKDMESGIWLYKNKYEYMDRKNMDRKDNS